LVLVGHVELHVRTSDWRRHGHDSDPAYSKAILHVVYDHDTETLPLGIPLLVLKDRISNEILDRYSQLIQTTAVLPCSGFLLRTNHHERKEWLKNLLAERWQQKLFLWNAELERASGDWHTLFFWRLAASFGFKVNAEPFLLMAQSIPWKIIERQSQLLQTEALLFGQAGFLQNHFSDEYPNRLKEEFHFLQKKNSLKPLDPVIWKFMRLRPANFPTIRLAQFSALLNKSPQLISTLENDYEADALFEALNVQASSYWDTHYNFDELQAQSRKKALGADSIHHIIINTLAPLRYLYAQMQGRKSRMESAIRLLEDLPAEQNQIIRLWESEGWPPLHAGSSQALIQLFNNYCSPKRCLDCAIGQQILSFGAS
jgi:hypothetical protein